MDSGRFVKSKFHDIAIFRRMLIVQFLYQGTDRREKGVSLKKSFRPVLHWFFRTIYLLWFNWRIYIWMCCKKNEVCTDFVFGRKVL